MNRLWQWLQQNGLLGTWMRQRSRRREGLGKGRRAVTLFRWEDPGLVRRVGYRTVSMGGGDVQCDPHGWTTLAEICIPKFCFKCVSVFALGRECPDCKEKNCSDSSHHRERGPLVP